MDYNSNRKKMRLPEYGRNLQKMVDYTVQIEDREERNRAARQIIEIMGNMYPYLRDISDFKHKLWDHIALMSDFKLNIDYPYEPPKAETFTEKPGKVPYDHTPIRYRHYGKIMQRLVAKATEIEDDKEEKNVLITLLGNHMKKSYLQWNKDAVSDDKIFLDLEEIAKHKLKVSESIQLKETRDILKPTQKKKTKGGQQGRKHK